MRVVLDTNIFISALMVQTGHPAAVYRAWQEGYFTLLTCAEQLDELRATLRKPAQAERVSHQDPVVTPMRWFVDMWDWY